MIAKLKLRHIPDSDAAIEEKHIGSQGQILTKKYETNHSMNVILCGKLQNPVLTCPRSISAPELGNFPIIPLVAKLGYGKTDAKFKLPFRALHVMTPETEFEFIFIKSVKPEPTEFEDSLEELQFAVFDCITFFCLPGTLKVGSNEPAALNIQM